MEGTQETTTASTAKDLGYSVPVEALKDEGVNLDEGEDYSHLLQDDESDEGGEEGSSKQLSLDDIKKDLGLLNDEEKPSEETEGESTKSTDGTMKLKRFGIEQEFPLSKVQELAQKGLDYTVKTQEVAEKNRDVEKRISDFEQEKQSWEKQNAGVINEYQEISLFFQNLSQFEPEVYNDIQGKWTAFKAQYENPVMKRLVSTVDELKSQLSKNKEDSTYDEIRKDYANQLTELRKMHNTKYKRLGIDMDEQMLLERYKNSDLSLKQIYSAVYGDKIMSLANSKATLVKKTKAATDAPTAGKMKSHANTAKFDRSNLSKMSYTEIARQLTSGKLR